MTPSLWPKNTERDITASRRLTASARIWFAKPRPTRQLMLAAAAGVAAVVIAAWMIWGSLVSVDAHTTPIEVGHPSPTNYYATRQITIVDEAATAAAQEAARQAVADIYINDREAAEEAHRYVDGFWRELQRGIQPTVEVETRAVTTTTRPQDEEGEEEGEEEKAGAETTTTTSPPATIVIEHRRAAKWAALIEELAEKHPTLSEEAIRTIVEAVAPAEDTSEQALDVAVQRAERQIAELRRETLRIVEDTSSSGILGRDLEDLRAQIISDTPGLVMPFELADNEELREALGRLVAAGLRPTRRIDESATEAARQQAAEAVAPVEVTYQQGERIVSQGEPISAVAAAAIVELGLNQQEGYSPYDAARILGTLLVVALAWAITSAGSWPINTFGRVAVGALLTAVAIAGTQATLWAANNLEGLRYAGVGATAGIAAALIFSSSWIAAVSVISGGWAWALGGGADAVLYLTLLPAVAGVAIPIIYRRGDLVRGVAKVAVAAASFAAVLAAANNHQIAGAATAAAGGVAFAAAVATVIGSVAEHLFSETTNLTYLEVCDRNHPALRHLEETAPGTYQHSIAVGSLADRAARAIGANPLRARAGAYHHDLGKTCAPQYFIENQFGVTNPHNQLTPAESVQKIRQHVLDGATEARRFGLPEDIIDIITQHHGDSLIRYFWAQAQQQAEQNGTERPDPDEFRHLGKKPQTKEAAIVMCADAAEAAVRALVRSTDPTPEKLRKLVSDVIAEKRNDHQFDESGLTFGDLVKIEDALVEALVAHYHDRVIYPDFPKEEAGEEAA